MSDSSSMTDDDFNTLLRTAFRHSCFIREWGAEAAAIDEMLDSSCDVSAPLSEPATDCVSPAIVRPVPSSWSHAIAASTSSGVEAGRPPGHRPTLAGWPAAEGIAQQTEDWWVMRRAASGSVLYVGTPGRCELKSDGAVGIVKLPDRRFRGLVLYSSADVVVVQFVSWDS